jgi:hypothetical protein
MYKMTTMIAMIMTTAAAIEPPMAAMGTVWMESDASGTRHPPESTENKMKIPTLSLPVLPPTLLQFGDACTGTTDPAGVSDVHAA